MEFKDVFKSLRQEAGKTQREIGNDLGVSDSAIGLWEIGKRTPTFKMLQKIADYFHVSTDYLMGNEPEQTPETYYMDKEAAKIADLLHKRPEYKVLFDASRKVKPEDIDRVAKMIDLMRGNDEGGVD